MNRSKNAVAPLTQPDLFDSLSDPPDTRADEVHADQVHADQLQPTLVRASAGTGKTYQLTARLLKILLQGAAPETILATTFTRKAAGEILDRVLLTLAKAACDDGDEALQSLRDQINIPTLPRSVCVDLFDRLLRNIHRLRICTLDSLFAQLARSFPFELGLPPAWRLTDEIEEVWLRERAIDTLISSIDASEARTLLSMLSKGESRRGIARELTGVVESAYTQQRGAAGDVWNQLTVPKRPDSPDLTRAAGHLNQANPPQKTLQKKLDAVAACLESREFGSLASDTLITNIATARRNRAEVKFGRSKFPEGLDDAFDILYAAVRTEVLSLLAAQNEATGNVLSVYDHHISQLKNSLRTLGFEDVGVRLAMHFSRLDQDALAGRLDGAIDHVLLDEFQDTSTMQWQVLKPLAERAAAGVADGRRMSRSFFCVGDTKQAIYGWRGGVAEIFDAVSDQIEGITEMQQNLSFRSSPVVIETVNQTFANLTRHTIADAAAQGDPTDKAFYEAEAVCTFARRFPKHAASRSSLAGYACLKTSRRVDGDADAVKAAHFEEVAREIAELSQQSPQSSIGVLTRTNDGVARMIDLLESFDLDVSQEGGNPLTDSAAVEVILSALMMAEHPADGRWRFHVQSTPIAQRLDFDPEHPYRAGDQLRAVVEDRGLAETVRWLAAAVAPICDDRDTLRLKQLTHLALQYEPNAGPRLRDFVRMVREKRVERPQLAAVRVMTVHQSKGLEFDAVFLPELDGLLTRGGSTCVADVPELGQAPRALTRYLSNDAWHFLPTRWQRVFGAQAAGQMTEALCLLYVAMTRARQALYMIVQPPKKADFKQRTAASLVFHALHCEEDPTCDRQILFEAGDSQWFQTDRSPSSATGPAQRTAPPQVTIQFQPLPDSPRRNRPVRSS